MTLFDNLYPISKNNLKAVCIVLADAFSKDLMLKALNMESEDRKVMYEIPVRTGLKYGNVYATSENLEGIIAISPGKYANMKMWNIIRSGAIKAALKLGKLMKRLQGMVDILGEDVKNLNIGPFIYLNVVGVAQEFQGKGFGGKMIRALLEKAENEGKAIYLETESEENVSLYEKFGFEVIKKFSVPDLNIPYWEMVRKITNV